MCVHESGSKMSIHNKTRQSGSKMSDPKDDRIDIYEHPQFFPNPDGTVTRKLGRLPTTPATPDSTDVLSKDIPINPSKSTFARIYLPRTAVDHRTKTLLPLIIYFHGGGFILLSVDFVVNHDFCSAMSLQLPAVVVSVGYRLAPEHRLPAAYEDAAEAIHRLKTTADDEPWLREHADLTNCYLMGTSAGGNIAYHAAALRDDPDPSMRIRGLILHNPFFGGSRRTESELRTEKHPIFPWVLFDFMWEQALPEGADRDHEYCNPTVGGGLESAPEKMKGLKVMVAGWDEDPVIDRQVELARMMAEKGIEVKGVFGKGGSHGLELGDQSAAAALFAAIRDFIAT